MTRHITIIICTAWVICIAGCDSSSSPIHDTSAPVDGADTSTAGTDITQDLCDQVACPAIPPTCKDNIAHSGTGEGVCDAKTGDCQYPPEQSPQNCEDQDMLCKEGLCVPKDKDLCADVTCPGTQPKCEGNIAHSGTGDGVCDANTGECQFPPGQAPQNCEDQDMLCKEGLCVPKDKDLCADVTCPGIKPKCDGNIALSGTEDGVCDPKTGECQDPPGAPPQDCEKQDMICKDGLCVDPYDPCGGKSCGDSCKICPPEDTNCIETAVLKFCNDKGECGPSQSECSDVIEPQSCKDAEPLKKDPYNVISAEVQDSQLLLTLSFGGGCKEHLFDACYGDLIPAGIDLLEIELSHNAQNDLCLAIVNKTVIIDLKPVVAYYKEATQATSGAIKLKLKGWPEPVMFEF